MVDIQPEEELSLEELRARYSVYSEKRKEALRELEKDPKWLAKLKESIGLYLKYNFAYKRFMRFISSLPIINKLKWNWIDAYFKWKERTEEEYKEFYFRLMDFFKFRVNMIKDLSEDHSQYYSIYKSIREWISRMDEIANDDDLDFETELEKFPEFWSFWATLEKYLMDEFEETIFNIYYNFPSERFIREINQLKLELWYWKRKLSKKEEKKLLIKFMENEEKEYFKSSLSQDELEALLSFIPQPQRELDNEWIEIISRFYRVEPVVVWNWENLKINIPHLWSVEWNEYSTYLDWDIKESSDWTKYFHINNINVHPKIRWIRIANKLLDLMMKELMDKDIKVVFWILRNTDVLKTFWRFFGKEYLVFHNKWEFERNNVVADMNYDKAESMWVDIYVSISYEGNGGLEYREEESTSTWSKKMNAEYLWLPTDNIPVFMEKCYWKRHSWNTDKEKSILSESLSNIDWSEYKWVASDYDYFVECINTNNIDAFWEPLEEWSTSWIRGSFLLLFSHILTILDGSSTDSQYFNDWLVLLDYFKKIYEKLAEGQSFDGVFENYTAKEDFFVLCKRYLFENRVSIMNEIVATSPSNISIDEYTGEYIQDQRGKEVSQYLNRIPLTHSDLMKRMMQSFKEKREATKVYNTVQEDFDYFEDCIVNSNILWFYDIDEYKEKNETRYNSNKDHFYTCLDNLLLLADEYSLYFEDILFIKNTFRKLFKHIESWCIDFDVIFENNETRDRFLSLCNKYLFDNYDSIIDEIKNVSPSLYCKRLIEEEYRTSQPF